MQTNADTIVRSKKFISTTSNTKPIYKTGHPFTDIFLKAADPHNKNETTNLINQASARFAFHHTKALELESIIEQQESVESLPINHPLNVKLSYHRCFMSYVQDYLHLIFSCMNNNMLSEHQYKTGKEMYLEEYRLVMLGLSLYRVERPQPDISGQVFKNPIVFT